MDPAQWIEESFVQWVLVPAASLAQLVRWAGAHAARRGSSAGSTRRLIFFLNDLPVLLAYFKKKY